MFLTCSGGGRAVVRHLLQFGDICTDDSQTVESVLGTQVFASQTDLLSDAPMPTGRDALSALTQDTDITANLGGKLRFLVVSKVATHSNQISSSSKMCFLALRSCLCAASYDTTYRSRSHTVPIYHLQSDK